ncbi:serine hydrolase domain-containing protein [Streptomyces gamaensis]|uniref:Serine hydrolase domain-containing protein n=1 Tax=Streptomyces gamaensis TaxID=1763542 RepID=A0ABW0Z1S7_9ACTN
MRRTRIAALALVTTALCGAVAAPAGAEQRSWAEQRLPAEAGALRETIAGLPSAEATAAQVRFGGNGSHWRGSSGETDLRTHRAVKGDERFRAGSVTKTFTAAVALQLVHERKLDLEGTVQQYLPGLLPADYPEVKVKYLLNHTSGLPSGDTREPSDSPEWQKDRFTSWDHRALVQSGLGKGMEFVPGTEQHYSNIGYNVLGLLIEKVTGRTYEREVRDRIINPLHLKGTYLPGNETGIRGRHTHGYQAVKSGEDPTCPKGDRVGPACLVDVTEWDQSETWASGDLISTTADLERFMTALFQGRVVPQPELELMFTVPRVPTYDGKKTSKNGGAGSSKPGDDKRTVYTSGMTEVRIDEHTVIYGKTGSRYGYLDGFGATRDLSRTLVYAVNSTDAKGEKPSALVQRLLHHAFAATGPAGA